MYSPLERLLCSHCYQMHIVSLGRGYCKKKVTCLLLSVYILLNSRSDKLIKYLISSYMSNLIYNMLAGISYSSGQQTWKVVLPHLSMRVSEVLCFTCSIFTSVQNIWLWNAVQILQCSSSFCSCCCWFWNSTCVPCTRQCLLNPVDSSGIFNGWNMMSTVK